MSSSAITTQIAQLKAGNIQNQADSSSIYSSGQWSFKNSTAVASVTISDAGNVGIGTASPSFSFGKGVMVNNAGPATLRVNNSTDSVNAEISAYTAASGLLLYTITNHPIAFGTNGTEKMRIDASGNLLVGTTTNPGNTRVRINAAAGQEGLYVFGSGSSITADNNQVAGSGICYVASRAADGYLGYWLRNGVLIGSIYANTNSTTYNTNSDYRLKEDIKPVKGALTKVSALKPCTYKWKFDGSEGEGFIAHELAEVCPAAVTGERDAVNEDGSIKPQGIDPSKLIGLLTAAIQELSAKNEALEARLAALESK